jgi:hypothetical protein
MLHSITSRYTGALGGGRNRGFGGWLGGFVPFDVVKAGKAVVILFDDGGVQELFPVRIGDGFGHGPADLGQLRALQNEHGSAEQDGGRRLGILEDREEGVESADAEMVEPVAAGEDKIGAGVAEGGGERLIVFDPAVDGDAMNAVGFGGGGKGCAGG